MKRLPLVLAAATAAVSLAACGNQSAPTTQAAPPPASTPESAAPESPTPTAAATGEATKPATGTTTKPATGPARCRTSDLSVKIGGGDAAAGTRHENLVFTNKSTKSCTIYGWPGVSWVTGDTGSQVNQPFQRVSAGDRKHLTLKPAGQAHAVLVLHTAENYPASTCKPTEVRGFRIYPPDETAAIFVSEKQTACSIPGTGLAQVGPITAGPGTSA